MTQLTRRQFEILAAMLRLSGRQGPPPTRRALAKAVGVTVSTVHRHVETLRRKGILIAGADGNRPAPVAQRGAQR